MLEWQRAKTTRRYIHPPKAERMYTLWADGKIIYGDIDYNPGPSKKPYNEVMCHGVWFADGKGTPADFKAVSNQMEQDGIPVHSIGNLYGKLQANIETLCNVCRKPTCYVKVTLSNPSLEAVEDEFCIILRTGLESELVFGAPDVYSPFDPHVDVWKNAEAPWQLKEGNVYRDGDRFVTIEGAEVDFDDKKGVATVKVSLNPGEELCFYMSIGKGDCKAFSYTDEKEKTIAWWKNELSKINNLPGHVGAKEETTIKNLTVHILQSFCYPVDEEFLLLRQGGLQRYIWIFEALFALEALARIGDFDDYIKDVISTYFDILQEPSGEVVPLGMHWAMATSNTLYTFAKYCHIKKDKEFWNKYRSKALMAFEWIKTTRATTQNMEGCYPGLFPPKQSCDCTFVFQAIFETDFRIVYDLKRFVDALEFFEDEKTDYVRSEYLDYKAVLQSHFDYLLKEAEGKDEIRQTSFVPELFGDEKLFAFQPSVRHIPAVLDLSLEDVDRIITYGKRRGYMAVNGLYFKMKDNMEPTDCNIVDDDGVTRVWYTTVAEYHFFYTFMKLGDIKRAEEIIESTYKYSMTDEYYMFERYHPRNPYFAPWSPNVSANGRFIQMLLDFRMH